MTEQATDGAADAASESPCERTTLVHTAIADAMETCLLRIECGFTRGFAGMQLIGNTTEVCRDGKERARAALEALGIHIPPRRLVVSLTPADVKKDGNQFDLPIAVSLALLLTEKTPRLDPARWLFAAELGLSGELRPVKGVVSFAVAALAEGLDGLVVAPENLPEVGALADVRGSRERPLVALAFATLKELLAWMIEGASEGVMTLHRCGAGRDEDVEAERVGDALAAAEAGKARGGHGAVDHTKARDFDDMILHPTLELAALVACAGMHSLLLRGSPGTGKSMLASRLASILPRLDREEHIDAMRIYSSCSERLPTSLLAGRPPYRAPHHQASAAAVLGSPESPGELSLAHGGVLFLDELPEFRRDLLESLREPLETGEVRVSRARRKLIWKARVILVAACNNCPCGWNGSHRKVCRCPMPRVLAYRQRLSGPILDRIDLHVNVPEPSEESAALFIRLASGQGPSPTARMIAKVQAARELARARNAPFGAAFNRDLAAHHLMAASGMPAPAFADLVNRIVPRSASSRSVIRSLRVARTIADLDGSAVVRAADLEQAWRWQADASAQERGEELPY